MAAALSRDIPITEYAPLKIKMAITGNGQASKEQVADMLQRMLHFPKEDMPVFMDATDGLAAASELPPDIDDEFIFHSRGLFGVVRCRGRIHLGPEFTQLVGQHAEGHNRRQQV